MSLCASLPKTQIYLEKEVQEARADIRRLQEEITALRQKVVDLRHSLLYERCQNKMSKRRLEDTIKYNDVEKKSILTKQDELLTKIQVLEGTVECLNKRVQDMIAENVCWQAQCNKLGNLNERLEKSKEHIEKRAQEIEEDLDNAKELAKTLEEDKRNLIRSVNQKENEIKCLKDNVCYLIRENENLQGSLEIKLNDISKLEKEFSKKNSFINQLEEKMSKLNCDLIRSKSEETRAHKEINYLKKELQSALENKSKIHVENRKFANALESMHKNNEVKDMEYEKALNDIVKLQEKIACYSNEFKKVEKILDEERQEKWELCQQITALKTKISNLESTNQTLEREKNWAYDHLHIAKSKIEDLQSAIKTKESILCEMECQIKDISNDMRAIKQELTKQEQKNMKLINELDTKKEVILCMEKQHKQHESEIREMEKKVTQVTSEIDQSQLIIEELTTQLEDQKRTINCLERVVSESQREAREESIQNVTVNQKVHELQDSVNKLQDKLCRVNSALSKCQNTCSEYKSQNNELQFQLVNEKYAKAFRTFCFSCNRYTADACPCPCKGIVDDPSKNKNRFNTNSTIVKDNSNVSYRNGQFTISVSKEPNTTASITVLDCSVPQMTDDDIAKKKSSLDTCRELNTKDNSYKKLKTRPYYKFSEFNSYAKPSNRLNIIKGNLRSELKGILKDKSLHCESPGAVSSPLDGSLLDVNCSNSAHNAIDFKHSSNSSKIYSSENEHPRFHSIAEESPPYRVEKKCYKKVCFSESDDEI